MMPINLTIYNAAEISDETALKMLSNNFSFSNSLLLSTAQGQKIVASFFIDATNRIYRHICKRYEWHGNSKDIRAVGLVAASPYRPFTDQYQII